MRFHSTRKATPAVTLAQALQAGLAPDGGLYMPETLPGIALHAFTSPEQLSAVAETLLAPYFAEDELNPELGAISREALNFPVPLVRLNGAEDVAVLELFHGPTAAFKDVGARFLAACLSRLAQGLSRPLTILVATSGDTGGAVASAFHGKPGTRVIVLYPRGLVSPRQEQQLTCWDGNVESFSVRGTFDDCQALVKSAFADPELKARLTLTSANSINIGRLLPQAAYYAQASLNTRARTGRDASFIVPSGNLGNVLACVLARRMGLPIGEVILAHNLNRTVPDYLESGVWTPRPSIATIASAMDVGNPSNMERLRYLYPEWPSLRRAVSAVVVDDEAIRLRIESDFKRYGRAFCPHTAVAAEAYARLPEEKRAQGPWVLAATAHPAKFPETVEPLLGAPLAVPASLAALLKLPRRVTEIEPSLGALRARLL